MQPASKTGAKPPAAEYPSVYQFSLRKSKQGPPGTAKLIDLYLPIEVKGSHNQNEAYFGCEIPFRSQATVLGCLCCSEPATGSPFSHRYTSSLCDRPGGEKSSPHTRCTVRDKCLLMAAVSPWLGRWVSGDTHSFPKIPDFLWQRLCSEHCPTARSNHSVPIPMCCPQGLSLPHSPRSVIAQVSLKPCKHQ